ncbi:type VI secretion system baseplate subunit TssG [Rhodobacteraceae bacterium]|nr:type VI secretion system baseplate subunit TssG [Paracoccaceae bacterium]
MAVDRRHPQPDLKALQDKARSTDFYELLRRLEQPGKRFGRSGGAASDPARLGQAIRLAFATGDIEALDLPEDGSAPQVAVNAIGLFGPEGPMPLHLTKWMMDRASNRWFAGDKSGATSDRAFLDFVNVLQHRMIGFYWRAWADRRPEVQHVHDAGGSIGSMMRALAGIGLAEVGAFGGGSDAKLRHATTLFQRTESPRRLVEYLSSEIGHAIELIEFIGVWNVIPYHLQTRVGLGASRLNDDAVVGARFFDRSNRSEVRIGPLGYDDYMSFIDDPDKQRALRLALRFVSGGAMQFDVRLMLSADAIPDPRLRQARLGQSLWLQTDGLHPRGDFMFRDFAAEPRKTAA